MNVKERPLKGGSRIPDETNKRQQSRVEGLVGYGLGTQHRTKTGIQRESPTPSRETPVFSPKSSLATSADFAFRSTPVASMRPALQFGSLQQSSSRDAALFTFLCEGICSRQSSKESPHPTPSPTPELNDGASPPRALSAGDPT